MSPLVALLISLTGVGLDLCDMRDIRVYIRSRDQGSDSRTSRQNDGGCERKKEQPMASA